jgi:hypothetical protein
MSASENQVAAGRMPDFLIIGAMKAGTTTLWRQLSQHPSIFLCTPKEPQFWSRDHAQARGLAWYASLFADARADQRAGEASTCYSRWPHYGDVPARLARALPRVKLIYLLRHPIERAYSHYGHLMEERAVAESGRVLTFEEALESLPEIVDASRYLQQIDRFLAHFPREALHVMLLDDLRAKPHASWRALQGFLEIPPVSLPRAGFDVENRSGMRVAQGKMRATVARLRRRSGLSTLIDLVPTAARHGVRRWLDRPEVARRFMEREVSALQRSVSPLDLRTRASLAGRLSESTRALADFLGRDLSGWRE